MRRVQIKFASASTTYYFGADFTYLDKLVTRDMSVIITDENLFRHHAKKFKGWNTIVLNAGEEFKVQRTADAVIQQLIDMGADRKTKILGVGGGVVTDLAGYVASVYMRGICYGFVPTTILGMVDAAIGGKNGINVGIYKNLVGAVHQPDFLLYDQGFLRTLPKEEWTSGFAEIIKHACIGDAAMFRQLEGSTLHSFKKNAASLAALIRRNALLKTGIAKNDEKETGARRLLNFGHTLGHAMENTYQLTHGQAISIGMVAACRVSEKLTGFRETERVMTLLDKFGLPVLAEFDKQQVFEVMRMDKKKEQNDMHYVLLEKIGKGVVRKLPVAQLEQMINLL